VGLNWGGITHHSRSVQTEMGLVPCSLGGIAEEPVELVSLHCKKSIDLPLSRFVAPQILV